MLICAAAKANPGAFQTHGRATGKSPGRPHYLSHTYSNTYNTTSTTFHIDALRPYTLTRTPGPTALNRGSPPSPTNVVGRLTAPSPPPWLLAQGVHLSCATKRQTQRRTNHTLLDIYSSLPVVLRNPYHQGKDAFLPMIQQDEEKKKQQQKCLHT